MYFSILPVWVNYLAKDSPHCVYTFSLRPTSNSFSLSSLGVPLGPAPLVPRPRSCCRGDDNLDISGPARRFFELFKERRADPIGAGACHGWGEELGGLEDGINGYEVSLVLSRCLQRSRDCPTSSFVI